MLWFKRNHPKEYRNLREKAGTDALTSLLLANRNVTPELASSYLKPQYSDLEDPFQFQAMDVAVEYIIECLASETPIRIVGDYDQDGVAATTIMMKGLRYFARKLGKPEESAVSYAIPDRIEDGYGLQKSMVDQAIAEQVGLLITVDNGIAAHEALAYAQQEQLPVIVTDHHQPVRREGREDLPVCEALLNPHVSGETYPYKNLCGAGVAFKLMQAIAIALEDDFSIRGELIGFAALGTICDVMPLDGENRVIASLGLDALNASHNPGLRALLAEMQYDRPITHYTAGFIIGPCINSSGRLSTARLGVELFLEKDVATVKMYARELVRLNQERKAMTEEGLEMALEKIKSKPLPSVIVEYLPGVHESLCGLIAGKIKEIYNHPVLIFTDVSLDQNGGVQAEEDARLKGSGRSIEAYHMFQALNVHRDAYLAFGGHAMACGITIRKKDFTSLRQIWNVEAELTAQDFIPEIEFDGQITFRQIAYPMLDIIDRCAPFGPSNPHPLFAATGLSVRRFRLVGKNQNVLQISLEQEGRFFQAVAFQALELVDALREQSEKQGNHTVDEWLRGEDTAQQVDILFYPERNEFNGQTRIQLKLRDIRLSTL